jgi:hypothetical protein
MRKQMLVRFLRTLAADPAGVIQAMPGELRQRVLWRHGDDLDLWSEASNA